MYFKWIFIYLLHHQIFTKKQTRSTARVFNRKKQMFAVKLYFPSMHIHISTQQVERVASSSANKAYICALFLLAPGWDPTAVCTKKTVYWKTEIIYLLHKKQNLIISENKWSCPTKYFLGFSHFLLCILRFLKPFWYKVIENSNCFLFFIEVQFTTTEQLKKLTEN